MTDEPFDFAFKEPPTRFGPGAGPPGGPGWLAALELRLRRLDPYAFAAVAAGGRNGVFPAVWSCLLIGMGLIVLLVPAGADPYRGVPPGFFVYLSCYRLLAGVLILVVPAQAFFEAPSDDPWRDPRSRIASAAPLRTMFGVFAKSALQAAAYTATVAPAFAFAYVAGGLAPQAIVAGVGMLILASAGLTLLSLAAATRLGDVGRGLYMLALPIFLLMTCYTFCDSLLIGGVATKAVYDPDFPPAAAVSTVVYLSYLLLLGTTAAVGVSFPAADRSTPFRVAVLIQFSLFSGVLGGSLVMDRSHSGWREWIYMGAVAAHVYVYGAFLCGEPPTPSRRVRRTFPTSFWGRAFTMPLRPGGGTGYLFCTSLLMAAALFAAICCLASYSPSGYAGSPGTIGLVLLLLVAYPVLYLGLGRLLHRWAAQAAGGRSPYPLPAILFLLMLLGMAGPWFATWRFWVGEPDAARLLLAFDPVTTLRAVAEEEASGGLRLAVGGVLLAAAVVFFMNLRSAARELLLRPEPVTQAALARLHRLKAYRATQACASPWDAEAAPDGKRGGG